MPVQQVNILVKTWLVLISETHDCLFGNTWSFFYYEIRNNLVLIIEKKLQKKNMI